MSIAATDFGLARMSPRRRQEPTEKYLTFPNYDEEVVDVKVSREYLKKSHVHSFNCPYPQSSILGKSIRKLLRTPPSITVDRGLKFSSTHTI